MRQKGFRLSCFLLLWSLSFSAFAQQYSFIHYGSEEGLPQSQVLDITQDSLGYLWIATLSGVARYDGYEFETFTVSDGLISNEIQSVTVGQNGEVWFGGFGGISYFDGDSMYAIPIDLEDNFIANSIYLDNESIWIISNKGRVYDYHHGQISTFSAYNEIDSLYVHDIFVDSIGYMLLGTDKGLFEQNATGFSFVSDSNFNIRKIISKDGDLIISTRNSGVLILDLFQRAIKHKLDLNGTFFHDIEFGQDQEIWGVSDQGLVRISGNDIKKYNRFNGLEYDNCKCLFFDREGNLWVGTYGGGLFRFSGELISTYTTAEGLSSDIVMAIEQNQNNELIIATYDNGINIKKNYGFKTININNGLVNNQCWDLAMGNNNQLWVATNGGVSRLDNCGITNYRVSHGLLRNRSTALFVDDSSKLWIGSAQGFSTIDSNGAFSNSDQLEYPGGKIRKIAKDINGNIWLATSSGIYRYDKKKFIEYNSSNELKSEDFICFEFVDEEVWVGSSEGLSIIRDTTIYPFQYDSGFSDLAILFIQNDQRGRVWIGTENGVYTINLNKSKYEVKHYTVQDGLVGGVCNMNASFLDKTGNLYIGTETGMVSFDRKELEKSEYKYPVKTHIKDLKLFLQDINWKTYADSLKPGTRLPQQLQLKPDDNYLTFNYAGINLKNPEKVVYRFKLAGASGKLSEQWSTPTADNFATFSNLTSGDYTFRVQATRRGEEWPDTSADYSFTIITPYYATWWFRALMVLAVAGFFALIAWWRYSIIRQKRENQRLADQSKMLGLEQQTLNANMNRHFVFNSLNSIQYYLNNEDKYNANRYLSRFAKLIRKNLDSSQTAFTTIAEEMERMNLYLGLEQMRFKNRFSYEFRIDHEVNIRKTKIPAMLFQPYLENSIWHGILPMKTKGHIDININKTGASQLQIDIIDNGIGLRASRAGKTEQKSDHISKGMDITRARMALFKKIENSQAYVVGPVEIEKNGHSAGTRVELHLPLILDESAN